MKRSSSPPALARDRLLQLTEAMRGRRIVVAGDLILDRYLIGDADRLSPEAPVPVVTVRERREALGGAANVAANVQAIGADCVLVGVVGDDAHGRALRQELVTHQIDDRHLVTVPDRPTTSKTRVLARGQQVVRLDDEESGPLDEALAANLIAGVEQALAGADALLLEDYNKGVLTEPVITATVAAAAKRGLPIIVDPKFRHFFAYGGATVFKPNRGELESALGASSHIPSIAREVFDVSGAGDTVTAWVGTALAAGAGVREAASLGNFAAGIEVGKVGVATVSPREVMALHEERFDQLGKLRREGLI